MEQQIIEQLTPESVASFLDSVYIMKDKESRYSYLTVNRPMHEAIEKYLFNDNKYKVRLEELSGMKYMVSGQFKDQEKPRAIISIMDIGKIVAVYTDYEGNSVMIEDLFDIKQYEWQVNN